MSWLFLSHAHITSERDIALQEWPECIPFDESTLPAGNIPVGLYGPSWWWTVPGTTISGEWIQKLLPWFPNPSHSFFFFFHVLFHNHDPSEKKKERNTFLIVQPITLGVSCHLHFPGWVSHVLWQMLPLQVLKPQRPLTCCRNLQCFRPSSLSLCPWASHGETEVTN